jgi:hypothetical protein
MIKLLDFNSTVSHPFSDRLIEYLLGNAITGIDDISEDIKRVQKQLFNSKIHLTSDEEGNEVDKYVRYIDNIQKPGIWTQELQNALIGYYQDKKLNNNISFDSYDFIGYVDKDVERLLGK